jgi:DNA-binding NarL/FixJ family response regulator
LKQHKLAAQLPDESLTQVLTYLIFQIETARGNPVQDRTSLIHEIRTHVTQFIEVINAKSLLDVLDSASRTMEGYLDRTGAVPVTAEKYPEPVFELPQRQFEILSFVSRGLTYKEIAGKLFITERTVKYHMREILAKLHLKTRYQAIALIRQMSFKKQNENFNDCTIPVL